MRRLVLKQKGFSAVELVLATALVLVIGVAGYFAYQNYTTTKIASSSTTTSKKSPTPTPTADPYAGWSDGKLAAEKLAFKYPSNWTLSEGEVGPDYTGFLELKDTTGFTIDIAGFKADSSNASGGGSMGAVTFNTNVATLTLGGKAAYLLDALAGQKYSGTVLSGCSGAKKCLYKSPANGDDIDITIFYNTPGKTEFSGGPDQFSPSASGYKEALKIVNTLTF